MSQRRKRKKEDAQGTKKEDKERKDATVFSGMHRGEGRKVGNTKNQVSELAADGIVDKKIDCVFVSRK